MTSRWIRFKNLLFVGLAFRFLIVNNVVVGHGGDHSSRPPPSPDSLPIVSAPPILMCERSQKYTAGSPRCHLVGGIHVESTSFTEWEI
ncbi:hypothetical protein PGT21_011511 [Puccinia graminis f. sp. tritici]|uniref:Uncharacterized protein n=1 Tax=Puccinia graminis f. sp. tritici TaxID=56615 RepID=A0A5B0S0Y6_PUCGR|nr:hypothetical protein PGT21_011511 [Puccinia graminis f. sp. tritici]KAA1131527.1 hypothetical protein PGTUg99_024854 [Puccinia graminis f. sp. tritici]